ncbi:bifunctional DNA-formamidopyrimidine glycosylase/DNA-(apurinic or apyrimidinic site) lyase [Swingsia samuiensis]|uniref:Formamidopyrimidine-DNA glycosylase n=1 Tax=Swingsia samuiensis TaxID=1293412 RepID=A0A4Y6UNW6_9PROT|nr:bifunctional DNA-formamidopyrimidine glycosylase/DNA-(apurinic or apyrimidinic site) lyase [Swingsia samuiensis]
MPELPEVETIMQGLKSAFTGQKISFAQPYRPDLRWPFPLNLKEIMENQTIISFHRRAKYILMRLSNQWTMILHLGMSGRLIISSSTEKTPRDKHEHFVFITENGQRAGLVDPRRFGAIDLIPTPHETQHHLLSHLGVEPLTESFSSKFFYAHLQKRKAPIKNTLLDQRIVVGLGNIYVCEALFRSHIHPARPSHSLTSNEVKTLVSQCKSLLKTAINSGGSTLRDYVNVNGEKGDFQNLHLVYGREGEGCPNCGESFKISRIIQAGRSTFFCQNCQK